MPLPKEEEWKPEWGGSLELYPVQDGPDGIPEPVCTPSKVIPPSWNQFVCGVLRIQTSGVIHRLRVGFKQPHHPRI